MLHRRRGRGRLADIGVTGRFRWRGPAWWYAGLIPFRRPLPACPVVTAFNPFGPAFGQQDSVWGVAQCRDELVPKFFRRKLLGHLPASLYCDVNGFGLRLGFNRF